MQDEFGKYGLDVEEHGAFIEELIIGEPGENAPPVSILLRSVELYTVYYWENQ